MKASQAAKKMRTQHFGITYKCVDIYLCSSSSRFRDMSDRWGIYLECFTSDLSACPALCHQINFFSILGRATLSLQIYLFHVRLTCCWLGFQEKATLKNCLFIFPSSFLSLNLLLLGTTPVWTFPNIAWRVSLNGLPYIGCGIITKLPPRGKFWSFVQYTRWKYSHGF